MRQSLADAGEALVTPQGGDFSIKREDQVLITETGHENLTKYPFDAALMGGLRKLNVKTLCGSRSGETSYLANARSVSSLN
jgi:hypothetical protein